ncbi:hypothetical protein [Saccharibacillus kuerlensis]|uniref:Uncharacterized protein n=1 Tax=Saccharibacillus kuerlensis TaxID=459527 RepID=A0ABQ2L3S7_9BACL|nr:hypothetical protein [Saccharibacillus kuerlensis]GGO01219.1 hypothetical protein GCM10010969_23280 [Saccharibacillus kuerlensis]
MLRQILFAAGIGCTVLMSGCTGQDTASTQMSVSSMPTASEVLLINPKANLFQYESTVYEAGVPWVDKLELTRGERLTKVLRQNKNGDSFRDGDATKLKKGTAIYRAKEHVDVLIADTSDEEIRFLLLAEG